MSQKEKIPAQKRQKSPFPWLVFLLLLGTIFLFWVLPMQLGHRPVQVEFGTQK